MYVEPMFLMQGENQYPGGEDGGATGDSGDAGDPPDGGGGGGWWDTVYGVWRTFTNPMPKVAVP